MSRSVRLLLAATGVLVGLLTAGTAQAAPIIGISQSYRDFGLKIPGSYDATHDITKSNSWANLGIDTYRVIVPWDLAMRQSSDPWYGRRQEFENWINRVNAEHGVAYVVFGPTEEETNLVNSGQLTHRAKKPFGPVAPYPSTYRTAIHKFLETWGPKTSAHIHLIGAWNEPNLFEIDMSIPNGVDGKIYLPKSGGATTTPLYSMGGCSHANISNCGPYMAASYWKEAREEMSAACNGTSYNCYVVAGEFDKSPSSKSYWGTYANKIEQVAGSARPAIISFHGHRDFDPVGDHGTHDCKAGNEKWCLTANFYKWRKSRNSTWSNTKIWDTEVGALRYGSSDASQKARAEYLINLSSKFHVKRVYYFNYFPGGATTTDRGLLNGGSNVNTSPRPAYYAIKAKSCPGTCASASADVWEAGAAIDESEPDNTEPELPENLEGTEIAPAAETEAASDAKWSQATLHGLVSPNEEATVYHFEYGTTEGYGSSTAGVSVSGSEELPVVATPTTLLPGTTYHYRIVASNANGGSEGEDQTFTTFSRFDFSGDGKADVLARKPDGKLFLYRGSGTGGFTEGGQEIGVGWNNFNAIISTGDFSGDGNPDLLARKPDGKLFLYRGSGTGGFTEGGQEIGIGWNNFNAIISPGDFSGDGKPDLLARKPDGKLFLYRGSGTGGFTEGGQEIGVGWNNFNAIISPGDFSGDGKPDLLARKPDGKLFLYRGSGNGGFTEGGQEIGIGWNNFNAIFSPGDFSGDGKADVLARKPDGKLFLYRGSGTGGFTEGGQEIGIGWNYFAGIVDSQFKIDSPGVFNEGIGHWCLSNSTMAGTGVCDLYEGVLGGKGDQAVTGDWNGDGVDSAGVFNTALGHWCLSNLSLSGDPECDLYEYVLGGPGNQAVSGDWNGDGIDTLGVFAEEIGHWCLSNLTTSGDPECDLYEYVLGGKGDQAVAGDWNGDGIDTLGVFNPTAGQWCLSNRTTSGDPECDIYITFGGKGDQAVAGDWNGDGIDTLGVFNPGVGQWCLSNRTTSGTGVCDLYESLGSSGDQAVAGDWDGN